MSADTEVGQNVPIDSISNRLMLARVHAGRLSMRDAADRCEIGRGTWLNWEQGRYEPSISQLSRIARVLGVSREWLAWGGPLARPSGPDGDGLPRLDSNQQPTGNEPYRYEPSQIGRMHGLSLVA